MKNLIQQFLKFGVVGVIAFVVDYTVTMMLYNVIRRLTGFEYSEMVGSFFGFIISVIVNYVLSMHFVFERREDLDKQQEFVIFIILSAIGLVLNLIIMWLLNHPLYDNISILRKISANLYVAASKIIATAIVTVYNFVTRKIFLEKKEA